MYILCHILSGEWKNGLKHGKGVEETKEGKYEGEWKDNMVKNLCR